MCELLSVLAIVSIVLLKLISVNNCIFSFFYYY